MINMRAKLKAKFANIFINESLVERARSDCVSSDVAPVKTQCSLTSCVLSIFSISDLTSGPEQKVSLELVSS